MGDGGADFVLVGPEAAALLLSLPREAWYSRDPGEKCLGNLSGVEVPCFAIAVQIWRNRHRILKLLTPAASPASRSASFELLPSQGLSASQPRVAGVPIHPTGCRNASS